MKIEFDNTEDLRKFIQFVLNPQLKITPTMCIPADILNEAQRVIDEGKKWKKELGIGAI
jgi:hypothetical protein